MPRGDSLDLAKVINAQGTLTLWGGCRMRVEAAQEMARVAVNFVDYNAFAVDAGKTIAKMLSVEAAAVTSGAAAGLLQATAACLAGRSPAARHSLPVRQPRHEVVVLRSHRNPYDQAIRTAGATLVEIGSSIDTQSWELEAAISERTAAVAFSLQGEMLDASLSLAEVLDIAHGAAVPVIVNAASELPPKSNLWKLAGLGADFVVFSGGKDIRGPQASGLVVGTEQAIESLRFHSAPQHGLPRVSKVGKEAIGGLLLALELYMEEDEAQRFHDWERWAQQMLEDLSKLPGLVVERYRPTQPRIQPPIVPRLRVRCADHSSLPMANLVSSLLKWSPPIVVDQRGDEAFINLHTLNEKEVAQVVKAMRSIILEGR